jgi:hypothetical protein
VILVDLLAAFLAQRIDRTASLPVDSRRVRSEGGRTLVSDLGGHQRQFDHLQFRQPHHDLTTSSRSAGD